MTEFRDLKEKIRLDSLVLTIDAQLQRLEHPKYFYVLSELFKIYNKREKEDYRKKWGV